MFLKTITDIAAKKKRVLVENVTWSPMPQVSTLPTNLLRIIYWRDLLQC
jgi:hypothetical protein